MIEARQARQGGVPDAQQGWQLWVDTGGTFTDCIAVSPDGGMARAKVLSSGRVRGEVDANPDATTLVTRSDWNLPDGFFVGARIRTLTSGSSGTLVTGFRGADGCLEVEPGGDAWRPGRAYEIDAGLEAPLLAAHWVTGTPLRQPLPPLSMRLATTRGTNALLERRGAATALFITRGFADLLDIGTQQRPDLFSLAPVKRQPLYQVVVEVRERIDSLGNVVEPLNLETLGARVRALLDAGVKVAAVALMNSYRNPRHEQDLSRLLIESGFEHVSASTELAPLIKIVPRAETAVVNAYLSQAIGGYLAAVGASVDPGPLHVLTSAGSLVGADEYQPKDSLLSGPAGGVVGAATAARASGWTRSLAFDMGGTSTDVSRYDGELDYRFETEVGDARLLSPSLAIETVAAGGGSICRFDGRQLKVGPDSAGADPGPACYGAGGPLTLTDVNLLLGRLDAASFEIPIDLAASERQARTLAEAVELQRGVATALDSLLQGLLDIADERMAEAVRRISIRQGYRPSEYALVAFGGAGGQHACALAEILGIATILVPADAGLLSAVGLGRARIERLAELQVLRPLSEVVEDLPELIHELAIRARRRVSGEGVSDSEIVLRRRLVHMRLQGQEASLPVEYRTGRSLHSEFCQAYEDHFGYRPDEPNVEVESIRVLAASREHPANGAELDAEDRVIGSDTTKRAFLEGRWRQIPTFRREDLEPGEGFPGPALVFERHCATLVGKEWRCRMDRNRCLVVSRNAAGFRR